ncbi:MAG: mobile mystery protein B [Imperialibacter sp.]|uniref:mobile mystery protein B n=1 Tax=Imperialibacter sp. TaxID=2038411 RepID=UPI0032EEAC02
MGLDFEYINGQTPLDEEERVGLLIETITTRTELDEFEQQNIEDAIQWTLGRSFKSETILTESFIRGLHLRMYKNVWSWAGEFRRTDKNIGIDKWQIATALKALCDDAAFWIENETYSPDETAIRFKHRLVSIHCFPNGNGRHSRLMADVIIDKIYKQPVFTWGAGDLAELSDIRKEYLLALKEADKGRLDELLRFVRS